MVRCSSRTISAAGSPWRVPSSATRDAVIFGNLVGFGTVAMSDVLGVFSGGSRPIAKLLLVVHLTLAIAFFAAWRARHGGGLRAAGGTA